MTQSERVVVVGVDFSQSGDDAIVEALRMLADGSATMVHALHVLDPRDVVDDIEKPALQTEEEVLERAPTLVRDRMGQLAALAELPFMKERVVPHARIGKAVETMLQFAVDYDADLIIVGTHGRRGMDRLVLGSVAEALVRKARCPVLVARPKDYGGLEKTTLPDAPYRPGEAPRYSVPRDATDHVTSTEMDSWRPSDAPPTGFRIV